MVEGDIQQDQQVVSVEPVVQPPPVSMDEKKLPKSISKVVIIAVLVFAFAGTAIGGYYAGYNKASKMPVGKISPTPAGGIITDVSEPSPTEVIKVPTEVPKPTNSERDCVSGGCNGEICRDADSEEFETICVVEPWHHCYRLTKCEKQPGGECGFTSSDEFDQCIDEFGPWE